MERVIYKKSFTAKMILAGDSTIAVYQQLKDACTNRKKVNNRLSFEKETIKFGRTKIGVMKIARKNLSLYLALDPKKLEGTKYKFTDVSDKKTYIDYPVQLKLKSERSVKYAIELLNNLFEEAGAITQVGAEDVSYKDVFYYRDFNTLLAQGLIKKYVYRKVDNKTVLVEEKIPMHNVHFTAKLLYCATNEADKLFIVTNYNNWDPKSAVMMTKVNDNLFVADISFPEGTKLEFKICRSESFKDVEKGIWKEEIVNHHYTIVDRDLEVEDLIHNFRID
jgi:predicted transport protein